MLRVLSRADGSAPSSQFLPASVYLEEYRDATVRWERTGVCEGEGWAFSSYIHILILQSMACCGRYARPRVIMSVQDNTG